jgi:hypothetical protein
MRRSLKLPTNCEKGNAALQLTDRLAIGLDTDNVRPNSTYWHLDKQLRQHLSQIMSLKDLMVRITETAGRDAFMRRAKSLCVGLPVRFVLSDRARPRTGSFRVEARGFYDPVTSSDTPATSSSYCILSRPVTSLLKGRLCRAA